MYGKSAVSRKSLAFLTVIPAKPTLVGASRNPENGNDNSQALISS
jgi:hypothetical protein